MAITYPREIPFYAFRSCTWEVVEGVAINRTSSGAAISAVDQYHPWWKATFETRRLTPAERRVWSAWKNSLRGGMKSFLAYDQSRAFPIAYPTGALPGAWDGEGVVTALAARTMTVDGVPVGYQASVGDHVGLVLDGHYSVHEIVEAAVADGAGELDLSFEPYVSLQMFSIGAVAMLLRPKARFILDPGEWEESGDIEFSPIRFVGLQVF